MHCCFQQRKLSQFYSSEKTPLNNRKRALYCLCAMGSPQFMSERFLVLNVCSLLTSSKCSGSGRANAEIGNWKNFFTAGCAELAHQLKYVNRTRRAWTDLWEPQKVKKAVAQTRVWSLTVSLNHQSYAHRLSVCSTQFTDQNDWACRRVVERKSLVFIYSWFHIQWSTHPHELLKQHHSMWVWSLGRMID